MFWDLSVLEILDLMDSADRVERDRVKRDVLHRFVEAEAISTRIAFFFADAEKRKPEDILQPYDVYPDLFEKEQELAEEKREEAKSAREDAEIERQKAQMMAFAIKHNKARHEGDRDGEHRAPDL